MAGDTSTLYSELSPVSFSEFTPSRVTRISSNHFLQEHDPVHNSIAQQRHRRSRPVTSATFLKGTYVHVDFSRRDSPASCKSSAEGILETVPEELCVVGDERAYSKSPVRIALEFVDRSSPEVAFEPAIAPNDCWGSFLSDDSSYRSFSGSSSSQDMMSQSTESFDFSRPTSFALAVAENPILFDNDTYSSTPRQVCPAAPHARVPRVNFGSSQSPPPLPPKGIPADRNYSPPPPPSESPLRMPSSGSDSGESLNSDGEHYFLPLSPTEDLSTPSRSSCSAYSCVVDGLHPKTILSPVLNRRRQPSSPLSSSPSPSPSPPLQRTVMARQPPSPLLRNGRNTPNVHHHYQANSPPALRSCSELYTNDSSEEHHEYRPVPPPRRNVGSARSPSHVEASKFRRCSDGALVANGVAERQPNFLFSGAGQELGRCYASYLGSKELDHYLGCFDECAQQLVDPKAPVRPTNVVVYVCTEKVRLAPPLFGPLFKSIAVKDILAAGQCSKNKRLVGITVWKLNSVPVTHLLRCSDHLVSNELVEAINLATQTIDDAVLNKIDAPLPARVNPLHSRQCSHGGTDNPLEEENATVHHNNTIEVVRDLLHKIPAVHVGSCKVGKQHSMSDVIHRVLADSHPSQAKEISVWLSITQLRLVDVSEKQDVIYTVHDTSTVRTIGVHPEDRRFVGYMVKEEGKPLTGHVLRCVSAGLAASLSSFVRQACLIAHHNKGDWVECFNDEDDDKNDSGGSGGNHAALRIISRLRALTFSQPSSCPSPSSSCPSFHSYVGSPKSQTSIAEVSSKRKNSVSNPALVAGGEFPEDFARFSVHYVGSAILDPPFTPNSIVKALRVFSESGVAGGKAAVPKNVVTMQVSASSIMLIDRKHKLFINRNYPRKQIVGYCLHPQDHTYFSFATHRPGFDDLKVHVFMQVLEPLTQVQDSVNFWLQMDPIS